MSELQGRRTLSGRCVLVVEDEYFVADDIERAIRRLGADVVGPVPTRDEALEILAAPPSRIDLAVLDINLRGETVFPVADALVAGGVPFVFATGYEQTSVPGRFEQIPRWEKPVDADALGGAVAPLKAV